MTSTIKVDTISENTSANGVAVDGVTIKDGNVGATGTATSVAGIPFFSDTSNNSIYTHDVSGTDDTAADNTAYGLNALDAITTGDGNTAIGYRAGSAVNTGGNNTMIGKRAGEDLTSGNSNVMIGEDAGANQTDASANVIIGQGAGEAITTGGFNILMGVNAGNSYDAETHNLAIGYAALGGSVAGGEYNVAIGNYTCDAITSGDDNTAVGYQALSGETSGGQNTAIGKMALKLSNGGNGNTAVGNNALDDVSTGDENTAVGSNAGTATTTGVDNIFIGESSGGSNQTGSYKTIVGSNADTNGNSDAHEIIIGYNLTGGGQNKIRMGTAGGFIENDYMNNANWSYNSDERLKDNIQSDNLGLAFINELRTVTYNWKASDKLDTSLSGYYMHPDTTDFNKLSKDTSVTMNGLVAQEVKAALDKVGADASKYAVWSTDDDGIQRISESSFVIPLIKAVQELSAQITTLQNEINTLKGE